MTTDFHTGDAPELMEILPRTHAGACHFAHFSSVEALARYAGTAPHAGAWNKAGYNTTPSRVKWTGTPSMAAAQSLAIDGWRDGGEAAARLRDLIRATAPTPVRLVRYDVAGARPNVQRAIAGNPMHMLRNAPASMRKRPIVTLVSDLSTGVEVKPDTMRRRAACVAAIVEAMELAGYSCHVIASSVATTGDQAYNVAATVKEAGQAPDIERLAFSLGHPSMLRRLVFAAVGNVPFSKPISDNYGIPTTSKGDADRQIFVIPRIARVSHFFSSDAETVRTGLPYLIAGLIEQGCPGLDAYTADAAAA